MNRDDLAVIGECKEQEAEAFAPPAIRFRHAATDRDPAAVEELVREARVFNAEEIAIARELVEENLARGDAASGYRFVFGDGPAGLEGYACFGPIPATEGRYELFWIAVRNRARKSGLAGELLRLCEDEVLGLGGVMLVAETSTRPDYAAAHKFYGAHGYTLLAHIADWHADGDGLAIFGKRLR